MQRTTKPATKPWDGYWNSSRLSSSSDINPTGIADHIAHDWADFFAKIKNGASILDICTGNGVVPLIALKAAKEKHKKVSITGIDQANIKPAHNITPERALLREVNFMGGVDVSTLPFKNNSFDMVTSQYGLEYTNWRKTIAELTRILKHGGVGRFVIHASDGHIIKHNVPKIKLYETVITAKLFEKTEQAMLSAWRVDNRVLANNHKNRAIVKKHLMVFNSTLSRLQKKFTGMDQRQEFNALFSILTQALTHRNRFQGESHITQWVKGNKQEFTQRRLRLIELQAAAKDKKDISKILTVMRGLGLEVSSSSELTMPGTDSLIGYAITIKKPNTN